MKVLLGFGSSCFLEASDNWLPCCYFVLPASVDVAQYLSVRDLICENLKQVSLTLRVLK